MNDPIDLLQIKIEQAKSKLSEETLNAIAAVDWKAVILGMRASKGYNFEQLEDLEIQTELLLCGLVNPADYQKNLEEKMKISRMAAHELVEEMNVLVFKKIREELIKNEERKKLFADKNNTQPNLKLEGLPVQIETKTLAVNALAKSAGINPVRSREDSRRPSVSNGINTGDTHVLKSAGIEVVAGLPKNIGTNETLIIGDNKEDGATFRPTERRVDLLKKVENPNLIMPKKPDETVHPILAEKILGSVQMPKTKIEYISKDIKPAPASNPEKPNSYIKNADPYRLSPEE